MSCCTLAKSKSDLFPLLLNLQRVIGQHQSSFKFLKMWSLHPNCDAIVKEVWKEKVYGCPMFVLTSKLKSLKVRLKEWNRAVFGDVHIKVNNAMQNRTAIQQ